jgi:hypothetical protein
MKLYFVFDTQNELNAIDRVVCKGENIGNDVSDVTNRYDVGTITADGKCAYISDAITNKYVTDRVAQEVTFPTNNLTNF